MTLTSPASKKSQLTTSAGWIAVAFGTVHVVVAPLDTSATWRQVWAQGWWNTFTLDAPTTFDQAERSPAFWSTLGSFGVPILALGCHILWSAHRRQRVPGRLGWLVLVWGVALVTALPASPGWTIPVIGALIIAGDRQRGPGQPVVPTTSNGSSPGDVPVSPTSRGRELPVGGEEQGRRDPETARGTAGRAAGEADHATTRGRGRRRRRRRWVVAAIVVVVVAAGMLGGSVPVGHFSSPEAHDRYRVAYDRAMRDLPRPDAVLDVRTTYGVVRVYRWDGPDPVARPLVLLPGRASGTPMWADNLPGLRALRTVYALDLLGEPGESVQQRPIVDHEDQARWLDETLAALPTDRVHLLGHSIGGWTAMNLALRRPGRLASVSVLDPVQTFAPLPLATVLRSIPASVSWLPRSWRDGFSSYTAGGAPVREVPVADMIEAGMQTYRLATPAPAQIAEQQLAGLRVPVLAVLAGRSVMHDPVAAIDVARRALPGATVISYPQATHALVGEQPAHIARDVGAFVAEVDR